MISYILAIDQNDDGDFTDTAEDITTDVLEMRWRLGMTNAYDSMAPPATAEITLRNWDGNHSPENGDWQIGKPIRIQSDDDTTVRTHFTGFITRIIPQTGDHSPKTITLHAESVDSFFPQNHVTLTPQQNVTADTVIQAILDQLNLRRAVLDGYLIIGVEDYNVIGTDKLFGDAITSSLETGKSTFAYVGDTWGDGIPADTAIRELATSERGRFFINRAGQAVFYNRHHTLLDTTVNATFTDNMDALDYAYGEGVVNHLETTIIPRSIGAEGSVLWALSSVQQLEAGTQRTFVARYRDEDKNPIGALSVMPPQANADYTANANQDGSGENLTDQLAVDLLHVGASSAQIQLRNLSNQTLYIQTLQLRGTPLIQGDKLTLNHADAESQTFYGVRQMRLNLPTLTSLDEADQISRYEVARRKDPRGIAKSITLSTRNHPTHVLARTLFDRLTITDAQTGFSADVVIIGKAHHVDKGGSRHRVTWTLEPADSDRFLIIGTHNPDGTRRLAY